MNEAFETRVVGIAATLGIPIKSNAAASTASEVAERLKGYATITASQITRELRDLRLLRPYAFEVPEDQDVSQ